MAYIDVQVIDENIEGRQDFLDCLNGRRWVFVSAEIDDDPRDVAQKREGYVGFDERQQRRHDAQLYHVVSQCRPVADNVSWDREKIIKLVSRKSQGIIGRFASGYTHLMPRQLVRRRSVGWRATSGGKAVRLPLGRPRWFEQMCRWQCLSTPMRLRIAARG